MSDLQVTRSGPVLTITLDRPEVLNAVRRQTLTELGAVLDAAERDAAVRAVVLTGTGRAFCAGIDLTETADRLSAAPEVLAAQVTDLQNLTRRLTTLPKTVIAAVNGLAVGLGAELAIASDIRVAAAEARFTFPEATRALYPTNGVLYLLPRLVGHGRALDLLLTGDPLNAPDALTAGLVSRVVPGPDLAATAARLARTIAAAAPLPVTMIKQHLRESWERDLEGVLALETEAALACLTGRDLAEGVTAFGENRAPSFDHG
ncbi:enoyl-CoA hydratase/isomerase family protein [Actinomadura terrae]|uniref:enoyl-CoA hydratase/isomerase family protein n=1 Tax=Actinomadura terrae TaxID=604353 RepID=UPI001FA7F3FD|nr:enoyl-CoA hydratase/isomerase family protein [Actinomadura terrae]